LTAPVPIPLGRLTAGDFLAQCGDASLVYFLLNVGDGDCQLVVLPKSDGHRSALIIDAALVGKLPQLITSLEEAQLLDPATRDFPLVVATHPHNDHIAGLPDFVDRYHDSIAEFWDSGFYYTSASYFQLMGALEDHPRIRYSQPTSGMTRWIGDVKIEAISPSIQLRNLFDTYGVDANNASIVLRIEFPAAWVVEKTSSTSTKREYVRLQGRTQRLILGGDAQTRAWAGVLDDFPELVSSASPVYKALRMALGNDPLNAQVLKVAHHGSKHGINLELIERITPTYSLISSVASGGDYNFPHALAQEALREALQPSTTSGTPHDPDWDLGIHYTANTDDSGTALGTMALIVPPNGKVQIWRFGDAPDAEIDLLQGRRFQ